MAPQNDFNSHFDISARKTRCVCHEKNIAFASTMAICSLKTVLSAALTLLLLERSRGFVVFHSCHCRQHAFTAIRAPKQCTCAPPPFSSSTTTLLPLYDNEDDDGDPVPRFVANNNNNKDDDDHDHLTNMSRLFDIQLDGREARDLLPPLSRSLTSGIECYFEVTDRKVQNLSKQATCHPVDAAWALEACKGDVTEAWLCISTARRLLLLSNDEAEQEDFDEELLFAMLAQNQKVLSDNERSKKETRDEIQKQAVKDAFSLGQKDGDWLPTPQNKKPFEPPADEEPWFTG
jgi:hypothetical protein